MTIYLDFETNPIGSRPNEYPPRPVGLAVLDETNEFESKYWAFGHDLENNCTWDEVKSLITSIWESGREVCFHNSMFDHDIIHTHFGLPYLDPALTHDTLTLAFLHDCHAPSLSLKALAVDWLDDKPEERDALFEWLVANVEEVKKKPKQAGAYICKGPGNLVGEYAMADVRMTKKLFEYTSDVRVKQADAYLREMQLQPVLMENSKLGVRVDRQGLQQALQEAETDIAVCTKWLNDFFGEEINFNSGKQLAGLIIKKGLYNTEKEWPATPSGQPKTDKDTLSEMLNDKTLISVLRYSSLLEKLCGTYIRPWLEMSESSGRIYTDWNAVRGEHGGTRTGRLSGRPTLQTMPVRLPEGLELPPELKTHGLPKMRSFILPDEGHKIISADYNAQELRVFAHYEAGQLAEQYRGDPKVDLHQFAADMMSKKSGREVTRTYSKGLSFAILYGAGPSKISEMLEIDYQLAKDLMDLYQNAVAPGLKRMNEDMSSRYSRRIPIRTLGGRLVLGEPPKVVKGKLRKFDYKMGNLLIQGSSADQTKAAMVKFGLASDKARLLFSAHDEIVITAREDVAETEAKRLEECMCLALPIDVPMVAESKIGNTYAEVK